jgi:hypothetical protein
MLTQLSLNLQNERTENGSPVWFNFGFRPNFENVIGGVREESTETI